MKKNEPSQYQIKIDQAIESKLQAMEKSDYVFPSKLNMLDYIIIFFVVLTCLVFLIVGAFL